METAIAIAPKLRRSGHQTQWAAQFAVASELCKRGYEVALTMGNHPTKDLMVVSPNGVAFFIDVKGLYKRNFWAVRQKKETDDAFYVFAFVLTGEKNRYFILSQRDVNAGIQHEHSQAEGRALAKGRDKNWVDRFPGITWAYASTFEDRWDNLPE